MENAMKQFLLKLWNDEEGAEIVEWVIVAAVLIGVAVAAYALLGDNVNQAVNAVGDKLVNEVG
jgi:Flp pilus assembly pilin Flp